MSDTEDDHIDMRTATSKDLLLHIRRGELRNYRWRAKTFREWAYESTPPNKELLSKVEWYEKQILRTEQLIAEVLRQ